MAEEGYRLISRSENDYNKSTLMAFPSGLNEFNSNGSIVNAHR
jgi:hypothetical protein